MLCAPPPNPAPKIQSNFESVTASECDNKAGKCPSPKIDTVTLMIQQIKPQHQQAILQQAIVLRTASHTVALKLSHNMNGSASTVLAPSDVEIPFLEDSEQLGSQSSSRPSLIK